jgi:hypothetical protein
MVVGVEGAAVEGLLVVLVALACPVGMCLMMWLMSKGARKSGNGRGEAHPSLEELRTEHRRLGAEIERLQDGSTASSMVDRD